MLTLSEAAPPGNGPELIWLGAVSFEPRCLGAVRLLQASGRLRSLVVLDYDTEARAVGIDHGLRAAHAGELERIGGQQKGDTTWHRVDAHRVGEFSIGLESALSKALSQKSVVAVDITCLRKFMFWRLGPSLRNSQPPRRW